MRVYAHIDFDGLVSAALLGLPAQPIDYPDLPRHPLADTFSIEVYHPENVVSPSFTVLDHHKPKLRGADWDLRPYIVSGGSLAWRGSRRALSMVSGLSEVLSSDTATSILEPWLGLGGGPVEPPRWLAELADALDNAVEPPRSSLRELGVDAEPREVLLAVFRYKEVQSHVRPRKLYRLRPDTRLERLREAIKDYVEAALRAPEPPPPGAREECGWLLLVGPRDSTRYYMLRAQLEGLRRVAAASRSGAMWNVVLWSTGRDALRVAESAGGGGRRAVRGYIAGFQAERLDEVVSALCGGGDS